MKSTVLPNNRKIFCLDKNEAFILYQHVSDYLKHGITLKKGDLIFDVGANIGLFTIKLYDLLGEDISIYAFEPILDTYRILDLNVQKLNSKHIYTFPLGLSNANKVAEFSYSADSSALSSIYPYDAVEQRMIEHAFLRILDALPEAAPCFLKLLKRMPRQGMRFFLSRMARKAFDFKKVTCPLTTISDLIAEYEIGAIDLLKIDVVKAELDVIQGIQTGDWGKIKQMMIEVHDICDRISILTYILRSHGFKQVQVKQEAELIGTNIYSIYAFK